VQEKQKIEHRVYGGSAEKNLSEAFIAEARRVQRNTKASRGRGWRRGKLRRSKQQSCRIFLKLELRSMAH